MLPWLSPKFSEQMQTLKNDQALLYYYNFTSWITKLSQRFFGYFDLFNTLKEVHIHTAHNQPSQNVPQPTIWPPAMK